MEDNKYIEDVQIVQAQIEEAKNDEAQSEHAKETKVSDDTIYDELRPTFGDRALSIFSYAISTGNDCLICGTFFRKILVDAGEDPDNLVLNETEQLLLDFGVQITKHPHSIDSGIYDKLRASYTDQQLVQLIAFAGIMYATNLFNTVAKVPLDEVLYSYLAEKKEDKTNG